MNQGNWQNFRTAPLALKLFSFLAVLGTVFFVFHSIILIVYSKTIEPQAWVQEVYFNIFTGIPIFLLFTGTMITEKRYRIALWTFLGIFILGHIINIFNTYEWIDIGGLQYPMSVALLSLFVTYCIHFFRKKKGILDIFKIIWFACLMWVYIAPRFIQSGHKAGWFLIAAQCIFPILMTIGLFQFYRNKQSNL